MSAPRDREAAEGWQELCGVLARRLAMALGALEKAQWGGGGHDDEPLCPVCSAESHSEGKHRSGCLLALALQPGLADALERWLSEEAGQPPWKELVRVVAYLRPVFGELEQEDA